MLFYSSKVLRRPLLSLKKKTSMTILDCVQSRNDASLVELNYNKLIKILHKLWINNNNLTIIVTVVKFVSWELLYN